MTDYIGYKENNDKMGFAVAAAIEIAAQVIPLIINLIGKKGQPNPNDWQGWNALDAKNRQPIGTSVISWIISDGDSIQNEALNILQYINNYGTNNVLGYNSFYNRTITVQDIANKLQRGGYANEANMLIQQSTEQQPVDQAIQSVKKIGTSNLILYGVIGLALFLILKNK
jgi:hypothetical protein